MKAKRKREASGEEEGEEYEGKESERKREGL